MAKAFTPFPPDDVPRPAAGLAWDYPSGFRIEPHAHRKAQLVYASSGVMTVRTEDGTWVVPPQRAVWVPGGVEHDIRMSGPVTMRTLYLEDGAAPDLPKHCCVVNVSPLLRELLLRVVELPQPYPEDGPEARLVAVLLDELSATPVAPLHLPRPSDPRLLRVVAALEADPADSRDLDAWARTAAASPRTLSRLFQRETGMSFGAWRQQLRLQRALEQLAAGDSVTSVALSLGYDSPSAFIAMFRRATGETPGRYFS